MSIARTKTYKLLHLNLVSKHSGWNGELILHVDYAENHLCKYSLEIQGVHFGDSHKQVSLHTGVAYTVDGALSFCSVSASMRHDASAIWTHLSPVLSHFRELIPSLNTLHMISDGPTTQYRSKKNFFCLSSVPFKLGFKKVTWNFLEAGHGKGAADGVGAALKRGPMVLLQVEQTFQMGGCSLRS